MFLKALRRSDQNDFIIMADVVRTSFRDRLGGVGGASRKAGSREKERVNLLIDTNEAAGG